MSTDSSKAIKPEQVFAAPTISWNPWLAVVFVVIIYFVSQFLASVLVSMYPFFQHWSSARANDWLNSSVIAQFIYIFVAEALTIGAIYFFLRHYKSSFKAIGLLKPRWRDPVYGLAILPLYFISYIVLVAVAKQLIPSLKVDQTQQIGFTDVHGFAPLLLTFVSLVILPPLVEEIMMRGLIYTGLKKVLPKIGAALVTSVIFASAHLQAGSGAPLLWIAAIDTFVLSLFLIYLREKTNSLWASMTLHASKNALAYVYIFLLHVR